MNPVSHTAKSITRRNLFNFYEWFETLMLDLIGLGFVTFCNNERRKRKIEDGFEHSSGHAKGIVQKYESKMRVGSEVLTKR